MKKVILVLAAIGFITMAAATKMVSKSEVTVKSEVKNEKYKACIDACEESIKSCDACEKMCTKGMDAKMTTCTELCKKCAASCKTAVKAMKANSADVKSECAECAKACEKCADECDKFMNDHCKKCAADCRKTAKLCKEMS